MRTEQEMLALIVETAQQDERIRAVVMNGSRANPNAPRDRFQDFDIVYFVTDVTPFKYNYEWIKRFGEIMIMQMPEDMADPPPDGRGGFIYLMQFTDGNRIDLGIDPLAMIPEIVADSLSIVLLDKDGRIAPLPPANESDYLPRPPTAKAFADCCNEFWWVSTYVAKGLWRKEILYARYFLDQIVREELMKMINWTIGLRTQFSRNPGKYGKHVQQYLEPAEWAWLQNTFADAGYETTWKALDATCTLFRQLALPVAAHFGFDYPHEDDKRVSAHLEQVRRLPGEAKESPAATDAKRSPILELQPMSEVEFNEFKPLLIEEYAQDLARNYRTPLSEERAHSATQINQLLHAGLATPNHFLYSIVLAEASARQGIGFLWVEVDEQKQRCFIFDFQIKQEHQGKGWGKRALQLLETQMKARGIARLSLQVFAHNSIAIALYTKLGYQTTGLNMQKWLTEAS